MKTSGWLLLYCIVILSILFVGVNRETGSKMATNLAPIPAGWTNANTGMAWGIGHPSVHYPISWHGETAIRLDRNEDLIAYGYPSISEANSYSLPIKAGDRIVIKAKIWAAPSTVGDAEYLTGASVGLDFYAGKRICEVNTPNGKTSYPDYPVERELCNTPWGSTQYKEVTIDFIVQNSYIADGWAGSGNYPAGTMVTPTAFIPWIHSFSRQVATEQASIYFAKTEIYINPTEPEPPIPPTPAEYFTVIVSAGVGGQVTPAGSTQVLVGTNFAVHASPDTDYIFSYWTRNGMQVSTNANYTITDGMANSTYEMVATFTYSPPIPPLEPTLYEHYNTGWDGDYNFFNVYWYAQTFTVGIASHTVTSVKLLLYRHNNPGSVTISINATDSNGHPTGPDLTTGTTNGNTLTSNATGEWREITLLEYALLANTKYAIVAKALYGGADDYVWWKADTSSPSYSGGNAEYTHTGIWTSYSGYDFMFQVWGNPITPPNPTFTVIISSSTGGLTAPSGTQTSNVGTPILITATASGGYTFSHWLRDGNVYSTSNPVSISGYANQTITLQAVFEANPPPEPPTPPVPSTYTVNIETVVGGSTNYTGVQTVDVGKSLIVRAEPNSNYRFSYWLLDNVYAGTNPFIAITGTAGSTYNLRPVFQRVSSPPPSEPTPLPPPPVSPPPGTPWLPPVTVVGTLGGTLLPTLIGKFEKQKPINFDDLINALKKANL